MAEAGQRQRTRAEGREQRRAQAGTPVEKLEDAPRGQTQSGTGVGPQVQRAMMTAAAAALAGGLAGAAKALVDRRGRDTVPRGHDDEQDEGPAAQDEPPERDDNAPTDEREPSPEDDRQHQEQQEEQGDDREQEDGRNDEPETTGADSGEVAEIIARARHEVEQLLGHDAEGVSGIDRSNGRWCVTVEVVELRRVPESTDVLASYAVVLDRDGDLVSLERTRRYRRSQVEG